MIKKTLQLTTPIQAHGKQYTQLEFREPRGKDIRECGHPISLLGGPNSFNEAAMSEMIANTTNIPSSSVDLLSFTDWTAAAGVIASFLGAMGEISSMDTSTAPSSTTISPT